MCGVPQGSILGPLIFILYVNQLPSIIDKGQCFLYADDTAIVCSKNSITETIGDLMKDLNAGMTWLNNHKLSLNLQKTKVMMFGTNREVNNMSISSVKFGEESLEIVNKYKYLGVVLDGKLKFDQHVKYIHGKIYPKMKTLGRVHNQIGKGTAIYLYKSLINPLFTFSDYIYAGISEQDKSKLQVLQNSCIRICLKCEKRMPRAILYNESGIEPLEVQRSQNTACLVYQGMNQMSTPFINQLYSKVHDTGRVLRSELKEDLIIPKTCLEVCKGNVRYRAQSDITRLIRG